MRYRFKEFELDEERFELRRQGEAVELQPQALKLLLYLLQNRERTPSKEELLDALWPGVAVGDASLTSAVRTVRTALQERATEGGILRTVRGRGYGIDAPVEVVRDETPASPGDPLESPARGVFVGRGAELGRLRAGLDDALAGRSRIQMLFGEPGIGKTRTAEELAEAARRAGAQILWGRCFEGKGAPAFWPWHQILRDYLQGSDAKTIRSELGLAAADLASLAPEVRQRLPDLPEPPKLAPREARLRLFEGMVDFLRNASSRRPLTIILDDLHGADEASLLLLEFIAAELRSARLLVVGTYRDGELRPEHRLTATLAELTRREQSERIQLGGLSSAEVAEVVQETSGIAPPPALADAVYRHTDGNAFFVREVVRLLASDGRLARAEQVASWKLEIPQGVREVLSHRLDRVPASSRRVLRAAAVLGREFDVRVLERMVELPEEAWLTALDEALAARLIEEASGHYRFSHALIRETLYEELHAARRVRAHQRAGETLEAVHEGHSGRHQADVAHHFFQALGAVGEERAADAAARAGDWAREQLAYEDAAQHYRRAVGTLELTDEPGARLCELLVERARLEFSAGDRATMLETVDRAFEHARRLDASEPFANAALVAYGMAGVGEMGRVNGTAVALLEEALERLGSADSPLRARLLSALALQLNYDSAGRERRNRLRYEARAIATRLDADSLLFDVTAGQGEGAESSAVSIDGRLEELLPFAEESVCLARGLGTRSRFFAIALRGTMRLVSGDMAGARADFEAGAPLADELRTAGARYVHLNLRAMHATLAGRLDEGKQLAREALEIGRQARGRFAEAIYTIQMFPNRMHRGTLRREKGKATEAMADRGFGLARAMLARSCAAEGAREEAARHYERLVADDFEGVPWGLARTNTLCLFADVCVYLEDTRCASWLYEQMLPYSQYHGVVGGPVANTYLGSFGMRLGMLATLLGRLPDAEAHFRSVIQWDEAAGVRPWRAHTHVEYARLLLTRDEPGDWDRARQQAQAALELAREIGMPGVERDIHALELAD